MTQEKMSPLRQRMIEDMRIRGMGDKHQKSHIGAINDFAKFLQHSPDTATPEELRAYQLHMADTGVTPSTFNTRIVALRFSLTSNARHANAILTPCRATALMAISRRRDGPSAFFQVVLPRFRAAPSARLSHLPFESDRAFPAQC